VVIREGQTFEQLYDERVRLYNKYADITVTENCENVETVLADLIKELGEA
jgi:shikimate kinase